MALTCPLDTLQKHCVGSALTAPTTHGQQNGQISFLKPRKLMAKTVSTDRKMSEPN